MIITNFDNKYLKITSDYLADFIDNPSNYSSIQVTGNRNCCSQVETGSITATDTPVFKLDLNDAVGLDSTLQTIKVQNLTTGDTFNVLLSTIALNYVSANCVSDPCTLATFSSHFTPLIKNAIDTWFASKAISSNVSVTFDGNTVIVGDLPTDYTMYNASYGTDEPFTEVLFTYGDSANVFIAANAIFISPLLFEDTTLTDGVYKVTLKFVKIDNSFIQESNCAFIDILTKCKVASVLQNIITESKVKGSEKNSTIIHLLHYGLVNGSNCGCNCEEMCQVYKELVALIQSIDPNITNDCGC